MPVKAKGMVTQYGGYNAKKPDLSTVEESYIVVNGLREVSVIICAPIYGPLVANVLKFDGSIWFGLFCKTNNPAMAEDAGDRWLDEKFGETA